MEVAERKSTDVYTQFAHAVAVLIKASLDAVMELDHLKNKADIDDEAREAIEQIVDRGHRAIDVLNTDARIVSAQFILNAMNEAEAFMSGFEGDEMQEGIDIKLIQLRMAVGKMQPL